MCWKKLFKLWIYLSKKDKQNIQQMLQKKAKTKKINSLNWFNVMLYVASHINIY